MRLSWFVVLLMLGGSLWAADVEPPSEPLETDIVETTGRRLIQIEFSVSGPPEVVTRLTPRDFILKLKRPLLGPLTLPTEPINDYKLDAICDLPGASPATPSAATASDVLPVRPRSVSYLLYFDQPHLTLTGRQRSLDLARELIDRLVVDGSRAMIISNAGRLLVVEELTEDATRLREGLARLEGDRAQFDVFAENEETRVAEVADRLEDGFSLGSLVGTARNYQFEEVYQADRSLRRLRLALSRFAELETSKAVLYFADTMRANAGEHYSSFFGQAVLSTGVVKALTVDNIQAQPSFDRMVNEAVSNGIRFYPVLAQGLVSPFERAPAQFTGSTSSMNATRQRHVEKTLYDLAAETGGRAFVRGEPALRIARRIRDDHACLYLVSFEAEQVPLDRPMALILEPLRDDIEVHARGRVVVQSDSRKTATRLLSGFLFERGAEGGSELVVRLVPTGYRDGSYSALLQIAVPGTALATSKWDMGASLVFRDRVRDEISGHIELRRPGVGAVLESEVAVRPGPFEVIAVAHETTSRLILSEHLRVDWPDPDEGAGTLVPVTLLQPLAAAFSREGVTRTLGAMAHSDLEPLDVDRPVALLGLVCRSRSQTGHWTVERTVVGSSRIDFPPVEVDLGEERCIQVRDVIPAGSLGPGTYSFETRLLSGETAVEETARQFQAQSAYGGL